MEPQAALVGSDGTVELDTVAVVYLHLPLVIHPGYPEHNHPLRGGQPLQKSIFAKSRLVLLNHNGQGFQHLSNGLDKLRLVGILLFHTLQYFVHIAHGCKHSFIFLIGISISNAPVEHKCSSGTYQRCSL